MSTVSVGAYGDGVTEVESIYVPGFAIRGFPIILRRRCSTCGHRRRSFLMYPPRKPSQARWLCAATCAIGPAGFQDWRMVDEQVFERRFRPTLAALRTTKEGGG